MIITATEFKTNLGKYLDFIAKAQEDIFITKNGKTIARMTNPQVSAVDSISGILSGLPADYDKNALREERFCKYEADDRY